MKPVNDEVLYDIRGTIGWITLNRPRVRNALTFAMYEKLADICRSVTTDGPVKALVVTGAGARAFAAGTDMAQFRGFSSQQDALDYEHQMDVVLSAVEACPLPTIAAIAGACTGGGAAIAAACDLRIASADLKFGFPIARTLGNCLSIANLSRLCALIGPGRTKEIIFTARLLGADEARACGLIAELLPDHACLIARAGELAALVAGHAPITLAATKEALRRLRIDGARADDSDLVIKAYMSADFREGVEAFLAKREPVWRGK